MDDSVGIWLNKEKARRLCREETPELLAEYFHGGFNEDSELALMIGLTLEEIRNLRRQYES